MDVTRAENVWDWPEFRALASRLGINLRKQTESLVLTFDRDGTVHIEHHYIATKPVGPAEGGLLRG